jgi:thymidylate synthase (FAD)|tara:strand:- start:2085 stop:2762 length:678 start_codon:yes stop_codon:yes gene_type:complete
MSEFSTTLKSITRPYEDNVGYGVTLETPEELIAYCARVSSPDNQNNKSTADKLLKYCIRNSHWSIFEMVDATIEIVCTRDIGRQILRHRSFSFQEFSQRYAEALDFTRGEVRLQDSKNRQNSIETVDKELRDWWEERQTDVLILAKKHYKQALNMGIAKEVARKILPEGLTKSRMYMKGSLRSWLHYCELRRGNGTQKEHRLIADSCWEILSKEFPSVFSVVEGQ